MASALQVLSREEINFLRVANLLIKHSPKAVRILFDREFNPSGLKSIFSKNWTKLDKLKKKHVITQTQWNLLFPSGSFPDSSNFDLTLMVCLLRNLTKIAIQDQLPQPSDLSEGAAVSRIKFYRNQIAHSDSGAMSDSEFSKIFDEVSMAIEIICPSMKSDCKTLKDADIDHSVHDIYVEFVKNEKQMEEMKQQQEELVAQVEILNIERQNIEAMQNEEISEWKKKLQKFCVTGAATRLIKVVKDNQCTIITGIPGSGKSALAYHVAIHMQETEGYTALPLWLPSEMKKMTNYNTKQFFVFDDVFETKLDVVCRGAQIPIVETGLHVFVYLNKEIHLSADKQQSFFDCVILENKLIFTDIINSRLVIFNEENSDISYIPVPYKPWGITGIRNDAVAISYPWVHIVQIVNICTHKVEVQIDSKTECWGLSCYKNRLYFVSGRIFKIVDLMGKYKGKFMLPSDDVSCVKVDDTRLLCTDREILYRCDLHGAIFWEFRMDNLAGLHGVTVDRHGNVYVAGEWSNNVVAISPDGTKCRVILTTLKGIDSPRGIYFDKKENRLLVSNCNGDKAFVFDAQK